jgi:hypothetical protein
MSSIETETSIGQATERLLLSLRVKPIVRLTGERLKATGKLDAWTVRAAVSIGDVTSLFEALADVQTFVTEIALRDLYPPADRPPSGPPSGYTNTVRYLHMASPLATVIDVAAIIGASTYALSSLVYLLRSMWGLDLELKTRREELRAAFYEAKELADKARDGEIDVSWTSDAERMRRDVAERNWMAWWQGEEAAILADWDAFQWPE